MPGAGELKLIDLFEVYVNSHLKEGAKAITLPRPWDAADAGDDVTEDERQALIEDFQRRSAMRDL